ncbi:MAG: BamA/TamA family outer membrane protein [Flavobacteriales bacterium]|nr:BamA/TamA family outer membrane protein [Flavobacteriales bacterium]
MRRILIILLAWMSILPVWSQTIAIKPIWVDGVSNEWPNQISQTWSNHELAQGALDEAVKEMRGKGFLLASADSIWMDTTTLNVKLYTGYHYNWANLRIEGIPEGWFDEGELSSTSRRKKARPSVETASTINTILNRGENLGHPFISVHFDSIQVREDTLMGILRVDPNAQFVMDTIELKGDAKVSKAFLYSYLNFKPGDLYRESVMKRVTEKLRKLPYVQPGIRTSVYFVQNKARLVLELKSRKTDQVDGIIGFAPNASASDQLLITGEANIDLKNLFQRGIAYNMHWKSFQERSQQLRLGGMYPFILQSSLGADVGLEYVKYDTLFFNLKSVVGSRFYINGTDYIKFYYQNQNTSLISVDTTQIRSLQRIPDSNPVRIRSYGVESSIQRLDYPVNPRRGFQVILNGNVGNRTILKDFRIEEVRFNSSEGYSYSVYDSIDLKTRQGELKYNLQFFLPIGKSSTIVPSITGQHLLTSTIFFNDLYRFGGTKSLRGFNEESILSSSFTILALEYRYLFSTNAYFQLFGNVARTENRANGLQKLDYPYGFGAGVNLEVNSGILTLAYALGAEQGNPVKTSTAKIHFGIINYL